MSFPGGWKSPVIFLALVVLSGCSGSSGPPDTALQDAVGTDGHPVDAPSKTATDTGEKLEDVSNPVWSSLSRPADPVVLKAESVPFPAMDISPQDVVAFRFTGDWEAIPVQVDERDRVEYGQIYGAYAMDVNPTAKTYGVGVFEEFYTDGGTFTGPDSNPALDGDDEIVFMAKDAGTRPPDSSEPAGVLSGSGVEVRIEDPLDGGGEGFVYLFVQDGTLDPAAGREYVQYTFKLVGDGKAAADYKTGYDIKGGNDKDPQRNPEDSAIVTPVYERHWSFRWTCDDMRIFPGSGEDILEKRDYWIIPGVCERFNGTFNAGEGCFVTNTSGPVRAIRSYMGANSGPLTQGTHIYYEAREDLIVDLRVHSRPSGGVLYMDYNETAFGMTYSDNNNPAGALIDGKPDDDIKPGPLTWEMVTGDQGSAVYLHDLITDDPIVAGNTSSFHEDEMDSEIPQCQSCTWGCAEIEVISDPHMIGASGPWMLAAVPNSDPREEPFIFVHNMRTTYYGPPGFETKDAELRRAWISHPLEATVSAWKK